MSTSLILPYSQPSSYVSSAQRKNSVIERSPAGLLSFGSFHPYGSCSPSSKDTYLPSRVTENAAQVTVGGKYTATTYVPSLVKPFQLKSPSETSSTFSSKSPTIGSPVSDVLSPVNSTLFNTDYGLRKSQSALIMPNIKTFFRQNSTSSSVYDEGLDDVPISTLRGGSSTRSLKSFVGDAAVFGDNVDSPQPLIRKCHTVIALSNNGKSSSVSPRSKYTRDKKMKLNFLRRFTSSRSAFHDKMTSGNRTSNTQSDQQTKNSSMFMWPPDLEERLLDPLREVSDLKSNGCSRCSSVLSLASRHSGSEALYCNLCFNDVSPKNMFQIRQCHCSFCTYCMKIYTTLKVREGDTSIECPDSNCDCNGGLSLDEIETLVGKELFNMHIKFRKNREIDLDEMKTWCPTPGCETAIPLNAPIRDGRPQCCSCATCKFVFCANCSFHWHPGKPCRKGDIISTEVPVNSTIKRCPRCKVPIERDAGCAQMQCKKCKHVFCWYCLASLEDDFLLRHYDKGPCKNKLGHSRASVLWHRAQVVIIFAGFGLLLVVASPVLLFLGPCLLCRTCRGRCKYDLDEDNVIVL